MSSERVYIVQQLFHEDTGHWRASAGRNVIIEQVYKCAEDAYKHAFNEQRLYMYDANMIPEDWEAPNNNTWEQAHEF